MSTANDNLPPTISINHGTTPPDDDDIHDINEQPDLAWRREPTESFSDWTIRVIPKPFEDEHDGLKEHKVDVSNAELELRTKPVAPRDYHVHRVYLAGGPRKSEYFKTLFSTQAATIEQEQQMTELTLPESACVAFERFLDFIYGGNDCLLMTTSNVVALHYLADYLQVGPLHKLTFEYIHNHMMISNVHIYCREGLLYGIDWVVESCIQVAALSPQDLLPVSSPTSPLQEEQDLALATSTSLSSSSFSPSEAAATAANHDAVQQVMAMLPPTKQVWLLQLSLSKSLQELKRFKRVPSRWKENIKDVQATHLPTLVNATMHYPLQGSGLEFPGRICPLFYFDQDQQLQEVSTEQEPSPPEYSSQHPFVPIYPPTYPPHLLPAAAGRAAQWGDLQSE